MRTQLTIICLMLPIYVFSQNIKYYGYDTLFAYFPSDIVETYDGNFLIIGDVSDSDIQICGFQIEKYLVRTNYLGDTLNTRSHGQFLFGGGEIFQKADTTFLFLGSVYGSDQCGQVYASIPFQDYAIINYSSLGDSLSTLTMSDSCEDILSDYLKSGTEGISALHYWTDLSITGLPYKYSIKELSPTGQVNSISIDKALNFEFLEKNATGYWLLKKDALRKIDFLGDSLWQITPNLLGNQITDFCKVEDDNLLIGSLTYFPFQSHITKVDSMGNVLWARSYDIAPTHIMVHSSGNYVITGQNSIGNTKIMAINPIGDSIWSRIHLVDYMEPLKTIESQDSRLITLAWADTNQVPNRIKAMYAVIFDSLEIVTSLPNKVLNTPKGIFISPNPNLGSFELQIKNYKPELNYRLSITNSIGQEIYNEEVNREISNYNLDFLLGGGVYYFSIYTENSLISTQKVIIRK